MDPNALLAEIREQAKQIRHRLDNTDLPLDHDRVDLLVSAIEGLDEWMSKGGFKPMAWDNIMDVL